MSEHSSFNPTTKVHIVGGHENSAFTSVKNKQEQSVYEKQLSKKHAYAYIKQLFSTCQMLPEIKHKEI